MDFLIRLLWALPSTGAILTLLHPHPDFLWMAGVNGGLIVTVNVAASMIIALYSVLLFLGTGRLITLALGRNPTTEHPFFVVYLLGIFPFYYLGLCLGLLRLNYPLVNATIFILAQIVLWPWIRPIFRKFWDWLTGDGVRRDDRKGVYAIIAVRISCIFLFAAIFVLKIAPFDSYSNDVIQLYYSYFRDVRLLRGIGFDPLQPRFVDLLDGRGMGLHYFLTSFTDEYFIRFVSFLFLVPTWSALNSTLRSSLSNVSGQWAAAAMELLALSFIVVIAGTELGKYHLTNAALYISAIAIAATIISRGGRLEAPEQLLFFTLTATMPIILLYNIAPLSILLTSVLIVGIVRHGAILRYAITGCGVATCGAILSMFYNYIEFGVPQLYPLELMTWLGREAVFSKWTHPSVFTYMISIQSIHTFEFAAFTKSSFYILVCVLLYSCLSLFNYRINITTASIANHSAPLKARRLVDQALLDETFFLAFIWLSIDLLLSVTNQPSLHRMLYYSTAVQQMFLVSLLGCVAAFSKRWILRATLQTIMIRLSCCFVLATAISASAKLLYDDPLLARSAMYHSIQWLAGNEGFLSGPTALPWNFNRCKDIDHALPTGARIMALNAVVKLVPCYFSPLTERGRFIHHYESVLSPAFLKLLFSPADEQEVIYKRLGIDYFLFVFNDSEFFGPGFGNLFSAQALGQRFRVYKQTEDYVILTWRGEEKQPLNPQLVSRLEEARRREQIVPQTFNYSLGITKTWEVYRESCGPTCREPIAVTAGRKVPGAAGTPIGNLIGYHGLSASFDESTNKTFSSCSAPVSGIMVPAISGYNNFIGKDWGAGANMKITGFRLYPARDMSFMQGFPLNIKLQGSNNNSDWVDLYQGVGLAPGAPEYLSVSTGIDHTNSYRFHRVNIQGNGVNALVVCQLQFFIEADNEVP